MCNVNSGGMNKKFQESELSAATSKTGPRFRTIPASSTPSRKISEMDPYPVRGVINQHATVSTATPMIAVMYSLNGAKERMEEACSSPFVSELGEG